MSTIELKETLLKKIDSADDSLLRELLAIIELENNTVIYETNEEEKDAINLGLKQVEEGNTIENQEVENEIDQWLKK